MESIVFIAVLIGILSVALTFGRITLREARADPAFAAKAIAVGAVAGGVHYLRHGVVDIKLVFWGIGAAVIYVVVGLLTHPR